MAGRNKFKFNLNSTDFKLAWSHDLYISINTSDEKCTMKN